GAPTKLFERSAEDEHGEDFGHLADAHYWHDPIAGNANAAGFLRSAEEGPGPVEIAIVNEGIDESNQPKHQDEGMAQQLDCFKPGKPILALGDFLSRSVRKEEAEGGQD